jgi:hypothetical protein
MPAMGFMASVVFEQTRVRWDTEVDAVDVVVMPINQSIHMTFGLTVMDLCLRVHVLQQQSDLVTLPVLPHILDIHLLWKHIFDKVYQSRDVIYDNRTFHITSPEDSLVNQ